MSAGEVVDSEKEFSTKSTAEISPCSNLSPSLSAENEKTKSEACSKVGDTDISSVEERKPPKKPRKKWKKPKGKPKRPLSAYNLYFKAERARMLKRRIKKRLGFRDMAKLIGSKWHALAPRSRVSYERSAEKERAKYFVALAAWKREQQQKSQQISTGQENLDQKMDGYSDDVSDECHNIDNDQHQSDDGEPLSVANQVTTPMAMNDSPTNFTSTASIVTSNSDFVSSNKNGDYLATTLRIASDVTNDLLQHLDSPSENAGVGLEGSFSCGRYGEESSLPAMETSLQNPTMQRILDSFQGLESSIDDEFLDFMSTLDFNGTPITKNQREGN